MGHTLHFERHRATLSRTVSMVRDFVFQDLYPDWGDQAIAERLGLTPWHVSTVRRDSSPSIPDLLMLLAGADLDLGITVRDPITGRESTFFPGLNLTSASEVNEENEEYHDYESMEEKPLSQRLRQVEEEEADELRTEEEEDEDPREEVEYREISFYQDLSELPLCENCLTSEQVEGSLLCHSCIESGVECHPPDRPGEVELNAEVSPFSSGGERYLEETEGETP